jgi:tetratricopeptide (TPR) repeat protein
VALAGGAYALWRFTPRPGSVRGADPLAGLTPAAAYDSATSLSRAKRPVESLPYYRRALQGAAKNLWVVHFNYGSALNNAGLQIRERDGVPMPAIRSSVERVALMREALAHLDSAEALAPSPHDRATVLAARAERLELWGLPWDAFVELRQAQFTEPQRKDLGRAADRYMLVLQHPEREP